jgi:hypothetical protein
MDIEHPYWMKVQSLCNEGEEYKTQQNKEFLLFFNPRLEKYYL